MADPKSLCLSCNKPHQQACSRCHSSKYCSKECQKADWSTHKLLCQTYADFDLTSRPSPLHVVGIVFPIEERKPQLVWLHCPWKLDIKDEALKHFLDSQSPDLDGLVDTPAAFAQVQENMKLKRQLTDTICIRYNDNFLNDGSVTNQSVAAVTTERRKRRYDWRGPMVAYAKVGTNNPIRCRDLDTVDFRHIVDFLRSFSQKTTIAGVRINCWGDQKLSGAPVFEPVEITAAHPIFASHDTSDIATRLELPLLTRREPHNPKWNTLPKGGLPPTDNVHATMLHFSCRDDAATGRAWGQAPKSWQSNVGSVLVVRRDKKPLEALHVETLCRFCQNEVLPLFEHSLGGYAFEKLMDRQTALTVLTRPFFVIFWLKLIEQKRDDGDEDVLGVSWSPYDERSETQRNMETLAENMLEMKMAASGQARN